MPPTTEMVPVVFRGNEFTTRGALRTLVRAVAAFVALSLTTATIEVASASTGPDVASYQHPGGAAIDWGQVRAAGHQFAFVKATEGTTYTNPWFSRDWNGAGAAGLYRGAYHYARPSLPAGDAVLQARYYVSVVGSLRDSNALPPTLDLEETGGLSRGDLVAWTHTWLSEVERLTGRKPMIYTGPGFWQSAMGSDTSFGNYYLWLASWTSASSPPGYPASWGTYTFWQYTSTGSIPGIAGNVDMNRYCCTDGGLAALADGGSGGVAASNPFGSLDSASISLFTKTLDVSGWVIDPDTRASLAVHVYVDGVGTAFTANQTRSDVGAAYPGFGSAHGFKASVPVGNGSHEVCVYAINVGPGNNNTQLGCRTLQSGGNPIGSFDKVTQEPGGVMRVAGWAFDAESAGPIDVLVWVNGRPLLSTRAGSSRPDVAQALSLASPNYGFDVSLGALPTGNNKVCIWALNVGFGSDALLGCRDVQASTRPFGFIDTVTFGDGGARVRGWAIDPDSGAPIDVHVYVDGRFVTRGTASINRSDLAAAFPAYGGAHGYDLFVDGFGDGTHTICVWGINVGPGDNSLVQCRDVRVSGAGFGSLDVVARSGSGVRVAGWAIDPDTTGPISVRIEAAGYAPVTVVANGGRPDVAGAFPGFGPLHGFDTILGSVPSGVQVCAYAVNVGAGIGDRRLGCAIAPG